MTPPPLAGLTAIVAGTGPGVGRACAVALRAAGADVVVAARNTDRLEVLAEDLTRTPGPQVVALPFDLADLTTCRTLVDETLARLGRLDILVNVATDGGDFTPITDAAWDSWRHAFEVNVIGTMELTRRAAAAMQRDAGDRSGGSIVQVGTIGTSALPEGRARYTATKQAMVTASLTLAKELGPSGIRVNVVTPGFITGAPFTAMIDTVARRTGENTDEVSARMARGASLRRHVDPEDVADAVVFLAGAQAITGVELPVTAGR